MMGIRLVQNKKNDNEEDDDQDKAKRTRKPLAIAIPVLALVAVFLFVLTQDMRLSMEMVDFWTQAHAVLFVAGRLCFIFASKKLKMKTKIDMQT